MKSTIEIGIKVKDDGTTTAIAKLNSTLGSTQKAVQSNNKELNQTQKSLKSVGSEGSSAFASLGSAISKVNTIALQPLIKSLAVIGRATTTILDSLSESFNKIAITGAIMNQPLVSAGATVIGVGFAIAALSLKLKVLYAAITILAKVAKSTAVVFLTFRSAIIDVVNFISTTLSTAVSKFMGYMAKFGTTVKNGQVHISSLGHVINTTIVVLQTMGERFTLVGLHVDKTSFLMSKLTYSILAMTAAYEKDTVAVAKYTQQSIMAQHAINDTDTAIKNVNKSLSSKYSQKHDVFGGITAAASKITNKIAPGVAAQVKNTSSVVKKEFAAIGTTVKDLVDTFGNFDTRILSVLGFVNKAVNQNGQSIANGASFIVKNFKLIAGAAVAVGAAMLYGFKAFALADKADELDDFSARMNMSIETLQTWDTILSLAGTSMKEFAPAIDNLSRKAESGDEVFKRLGVSVKNVDGTFKNTEQIFNDSMMALAGVQDQTQRSALTLEVFGKQGGRLNGILATGTVGIAGMTAEYAKYNTITKDMTKEGAKWNDTVALIGKSIEKGSNKYLVMFLNRFNHLLEVIKNSNLERLLVGPLFAIGGAALLLTATIAKLIEVLSLLGNIVNVVANGFNVMFAGIFKGIAMLPGVSSNIKLIADEFLALSVAGAQASGTGFVDNLKRVLELQNDAEKSLREYGNTITDVADKEKKLKNVQDDGWNSLRENLRSSLLERTEAGRLLLINEEEVQRLTLAAKNKASQLDIQRIKYDAQLKRNILIEEAAKTEQDRQDATIAAESGWYKFQLDKQKDSVKKSMELIDLAYADEYSKLLEQKDLQYITEETYQQRLLDLEKMSADEKAKIQKDSEKAISDERKKNIEELATGTFGVLGDIAKMNQDSRLSDIANESEANKKKLDGLKVSDRRKAMMEKEIDDKRLAEEKKIKNKQKAWSLSQIAINTAQGISKVWAESGVAVPVAVAMTALQTAMGATQASMVASQSFANSGVVGGFQGSQTGMDNTLVNARKGEMFLNTQDQKTLFNGIKSGNLGGGAGTVQITQGNIVIQGGANQSAIDQIKAETQRFSSLVKETVLDLQYRRQLSFA